MILILSVAAAAAAAVLTYNAWLARDPARTAGVTGRVQQLAAVVLVLSKAVEGVVDAVTSPRNSTPPSSTSAAPSTWTTRQALEWGGYDDDHFR